MRKLINPAAIGRPASAYNHAVLIERPARTLYLSGQIGERPDGSISPDFREQARQSWSNIQAILAEGMVDVGRALDPDNEGLFTWWAPWRNLRQRNIGWRIDYVLASASLAGRATACAVRADVGTSDHAPVVADFGTP